MHANLKIAGSNFFGKLKIDLNLVVKSKVPSRSGFVALRQLNPIHKTFTHEIKTTQKNESEE